MTLHPLKQTVYIDGSSVAKSGIRNYEILAFFAANVADVTSRDLTGTMIILCPFANSGKPFWFDSTDSTTVHNGTTCLVDTAGNRFKVWAILSTDLTASIINTALGAGGLDPATIPGSGTRKFLARGDAGGFVATDILTVISWLDTALGGTGWRDTNTNVGSSSIVTALPSGTDWKTGGRGNRQRAVLFSDGTVGVAGANADAAPDGVLTTNARFMKIAFADGVQRVITKFWMGGGGQIPAYLHALDSNGILWAWGYNLHGELGIGNIVSKSVWTEVTFFRTNSLTVAKVFTGPDSLDTYFLTTQANGGLLYYSGYNNNGQAGDTTTAVKNAPVRCGTLTNVTDVFPGCQQIDGTANSVAAITSAAGGTLFTWGYNGVGQLGIGNLTQQTAPVSSLTGVTKVCMGGSSLALKSDGTLWSCGINDVGGTCQNTLIGNTITWSPVTLANLGITAGNVVLDISSNGGRFVHGMAIVTVGGTGRFLRTWGYNGYGAPGDGTVGTHRSTGQTPAGAWQGSVDEIVGCGPSGVNAKSQNFIRVGNRILGAGNNENGVLCNGTITSPISVFGDVLGIRGNILSWWVNSADTIGGLMVLTDQGCLSGGYNGQGQVGTHEANLHNVLVLEDILPQGRVVGQAAVSLMPQTFKNIAHANGGFEIWQRGAGSSANIAVAASTTAYTADRWYLTTSASQACHVAATTPLTDTSQLAAKVIRDSGQTGTGVIKFGYPLDTDDAIRCRNQVLALSFTVKAGANWSPASGALTFNLFLGTGAAAKQGGGFTGQSNPITGTVNATAFVQRVVATATIVGLTNALQGEIQFSFAPVGTAGADDSFVVDDVQVEIVPSTSYSASPFERVPFEVSILNCQRHYHNTFPYAVAPAASAGRAGAIEGVQVVGASTAQYLNTYKYPVKMRAAPAVVTIYNPSAAGNQARDVTDSLNWSATTVDATSSSEDGATVSGISPAATALGKQWSFHLEADAGI